MSLLFESIRVADGKFENLIYHEQRMRKSLRIFYGFDEPFDLEKYLNNIPLPVEGVYKCRLAYDDQQRSVELSEYRPKPITSLRVVEHDRINYEFKFQDRKTIEDLYSLRGSCQDVIIVRKGLVTDSSYGNLAFKKGKQWYTPWQPLLKGTMRQQLVEYNTIQEEEITVKDIKNFDSIKIVNAMLRFDSTEIPITNVFF